MVEHRRMSTLNEIAVRYGAAENTVRKKWRKRETWPEPVGKRGRENLYDDAEVAAEYRRIVGLPEVEGSPGDLLTWREVCAYLGKGGTALKTMEWRRWAGVWPVGVVGRDGEERWRRDAVDDAHAEITRSRGPS